MMATEGLMVCNTIPGSPASSPERNFHVLYFKKFSFSLFSQLTFLGLTFASTQISFGTLMQFGFNTNLEILAICKESEHEYYHYYYYSQNFYQKNINHSCDLEM